MAELKEACGVFGMYDLDGGNVVPSIYYGLTSLNHQPRTIANLGNHTFAFLCSVPSVGLSKLHTHYYSSTWSSGYTTCKH